LDEWKHMPSIVTTAGKTTVDSGYAVRVLRVKGIKGIVIKYPPLASQHYKVTPNQEIRFVRRAVDLANKQFGSMGFNMHKPIGHPVGPFIVMGRSNYPTADDIIREHPPAKARRMLSNLSKQLNIPEKELKEKIRDYWVKVSVETDEWLEKGLVKLTDKHKVEGGSIFHKNGYSFSIDPFNLHHLQVIGQTNGVIQIVPFIDAI